MFEYPERRDEEDETAEGETVSQSGGLAFDASDDAHEHCNTTDRSKQTDRHPLSQSDSAERPLRGVP
ncbi:hypothetical protein RE9427_17480 [Prescottella equi]|nr:hypothetical protein RE9427_17480 [Prescottella equi]